MLESRVNPIHWDEKLGRYVEAPENYTGPSTKVSGRVAQENAVQHFIARQLELIAIALATNTGQGVVSEYINEVEV